MNDKIKEKKRMRYLKTLQHLARKYQANIAFTYFPNPEHWSGEFNVFPKAQILVSAGTFTEMVRYLHMKVRTEL